MADSIIDPATEVKEVEKIDLNKISLESLIMLIHTNRLKTLQDKTKTELETLKKRQEDVRKLHTLLQQINAATDSNGKMDASNLEELQKLLKFAKDLGVNVKEGKNQYSYTKEERDRLIENIRMSTDDLNVLNDMQLQSVSRLTNERFEMFQMTRSILKPLHDDKQRKAREMGGK